MLPGATRHRRRSPVNFVHIGQDILLENIRMEINKLPEFYFHMKISRKIFFPILGVSYTTRQMTYGSVYSFC